MSYICLSILQPFNYKALHILNKSFLLILPLILYFTVIGVIYNRLMVNGQNGPDGQRVAIIVDEVILQELGDVKTQHRNMAVITVVRISKAQLSKDLAIE